MLEENSTLYLNISILLYRYYELWILQNNSTGLKFLDLPVSGSKFYCLTLTMWLSLTADFLCLEGQWSQKTWTGVNITQTFTKLDRRSQTALTEWSLQTLVVVTGVYWVSEHMYIPIPIKSGSEIQHKK